MAKLSIEIPDAVVHQVRLSGDTIEVAILKALDEYLVRQARQASQASKATDITQTRTWQLCGRFSLAESSSEGNLDVADAEETAYSADGRIGYSRPSSTI